MDLLKSNKVIQRSSAFIIIILALLRIAHFIGHTTFLWLAFGFTFIALMISQRAVEKLQAKVETLETEKEG